MVNTVFEKDGLPYRVVIEVGDVVFCYPLWESQKFECLNRNTVIDGLENGTLKQIFEKNLPSPYDLELTEKEEVRLEPRYERIKNIWDNHKYQLADPNRTNKTLDRIAAKYKISRSTLLRHLDSFLKGSGYSGNKQSMATGYGNCGSPGKRKKYRPGKTGSETVIPSYYMEPLYDKYLKKVRKKGENGKPTDKFINGVWKKMKFEYFTDSEGETVPFFPPLDQFYRWAMKHYGQGERLKEFYGDKDYHKNHRQLTGAATDTAQGPNFVWETDCSTVDIEIVDRYNREKPIGCPKIILYRDVYSRMIMGVHVFIGYESWYQYVNGLVMAVSPKQEKAAEVNLEIEPDEWPNEGILPMAIRADRGPFTHESHKQVVKRLGTEVEFARAGDPTAKGTVERTFHTLHDWATTMLPGCKHFTKDMRGEKDPAMSAKLTLPELTAIIYALVIEYNTTNHPGFSLTPEMIASGVSRVPVEIYRFGMKQHLGQFRTFEPSAVYNYLLPQEDRVVRREGIRINNKTYVAENNKDTAWLRDHRKDKVKISYDTSDPGYILLWKENGTSMEMVAKGWDKKFTGIDISEEQAYAKMDKQTEKEKESEWNRIAMKTEDRIASISDGITDPVDKASRRKEIKNKRENKRKAIERERSETAKTFRAVPDTRPQTEQNVKKSKILDKIVAGL